MFGKSDLEILLREKDSRLESKDLQLESKDVQLDLMAKQLRMTIVVAALVTVAAAVVAVVVTVFTVTMMERLVQEKAAVVQEKERQLAKAEAEVATTRARFQAEWNLRPVLETHLTRWFVENGLPVPNGGQQKLNEYMNYGFPDRRHFEDHLDAAIRKNSLHKTKKNDVLSEINHLFHTLSKKHHTGDVPDGVKGFVVNNDAVFSAAVSSFFMSLGLPHTVLRESPKGGYVEVYKWENAGVGEIDGVVETDGAGENAGERENLDEGETSPQLFQHADY